jgi:hypothetical protein
VAAGSLALLANCVLHLLHKLLRAILRPGSLRGLPAALPHCLGLVRLTQPCLQGLYHLLLGRQVGIWIYRRQRLGLRPACKRCQGVADSNAAWAGQA